MFGSQPCASDRKRNDAIAVSLRFAISAAASVFFAIVCTGLEAQQQSPDDSNPYRAASVVRGRVTAMKSSQEYCAQEDPPSVESIAAAVKTWLERHAQLYERALQVTRSRFTHEELRQLEANDVAAHEAFKAEMAGQPRAARVSYCGNLAARILSPDLSLLQRSKLVAALEGFRE
jgi:hypothetical protein